MAIKPEVLIKNEFESEVFTHLSRNSNHKLKTYLNTWLYCYKSFLIIICEERSYKRSKISIQSQMSVVHMNLRQLPWKYSQKYCFVFIISNNNSNNAKLADSSCYWLNCKLNILNAHYNRLSYEPRSSAITSKEI